MHKVSESGKLCSKKGKEGLGHRNQDVYLTPISMFSMFYCEVATNLIMDIVYLEKTSAVYESVYSK